MNDFAASWSLSRKRLEDEIAGLNQAQLNWRIHPGSLTIGEMVIHVAGVEMSFGSQLTGESLDEQGEKLKRAATEGVVDRAPFPYSSEEITPEAVADALARGRAIWEPIVSAATPESRGRQIKSALGPMISGEGAFARLGFHSGYHQGQAYLIKTMPDFPK